ncbi:MAG: hypothetical protein KAW12_29200 [Candidatus Aminicenantes bacterium]|nr:hypothetical protein [Candidatus Aminicenantes bacterium]
MKNTLWDSSEMQEAAELFKSLLKSSPDPAPTAPAEPDPAQPEISATPAEPEPEPVPEPRPTPAAAAMESAEAAEKIEETAAAEAEPEETAQAEEAEAPSDVLQVEEQEIPEENLEFEKKEPPKNNAPVKEKEAPGVEPQAEKGETGKAGSTPIEEYPRWNETPPAAADEDTGDEDIDEDLDIEIEIEDNEDAPEDPLGKALKEMCTRGGFPGAVLADREGHPLALYNSPLAVGIMVEFITSLGQTLDETAALLHKPEAGSISIAVDESDKLVLRKFSMKDIPYYLVILCSRGVDERAGAALAVAQISAILRRS